MKEARTTVATKAQPVTVISPSEARLRLQAGLPVSERCMKLVGISTCVLEGRNGPPIVLLPVRANTRPSGSG